MIMITTVLFGLLDPACNTFVSIFSRHVNNLRHRLSLTSVLGSVFKTFASEQGKLQGDRCYTTATCLF